jgi:GT2 family glycosyltransferase
MLIRADVMRQLGGFDDRYFLNWEDVDLCLRVRAMGSSIGLVPAARIYHKVSRSFARASGISCYYHVRNNLLLVSLYSGEAARQAVKYVIATRLREGLRNIKDGRAASGKNLIFIIRAIHHHKCRRYGFLSLGPGRELL